MSQAEKAAHFAALHKKGEPLVLLNIWDAGGARAIVEAGSPAVATGSASIAGAWGYPDGEKLPLELLLTIVGRIAATVDVPVTVDFEGGYASAPADLAANVARLIGLGIVGVNFEDQVVGQERLYPTTEQCARIAALVSGAAGVGVPLFVNARTDLFLKAHAEDHRRLLPEAIDRAAAYGAAGAKGYFVPGLVDASLIADLCAAVSLPINVMMSPSAPEARTLASAGVARLSHGPFPWLNSMRQLADAWRSIAVS